MTRSVTASDTLPALLTADGRRDRSTMRVEGALVPFFDLTIGEQLRFAAVVNEYVGAAFDEPETEAARERRRQAAALEAMDAAARYHQLPGGTGLTGDQYEQARAALGLMPTRREIADAFERWNRANDVFTGRARHETARQKQLRRRAQLARMYGALELRHIRAVQQWLAEPRPARTRADYDLFARARNETESDATKHLVLGGAINAHWGVFFADFVAFVKGDITIEEARARRIADLESQGDCDLMLRDHVLALLRCTYAQLKYYLASGQFLAPSVRFSGQRVAWLREDVSAFLAGEDVPDRDPHELRRRYLSPGEFADLMDVPPEAVRGWFRYRRWDRMPAPDAKFATFSYWKRADVEAWLAERS
jgi:hypothetical protein